MPESIEGYGDLDIAEVLRSAADESMFGEGDPQRSLDLQHLDFIVRQFSPVFTARGLGEYLMALDDQERRRLLAPYYLPSEWRDKTKPG